MNIGKIKTIALTIVFIVILGCFSAYAQGTQYEKAYWYSNGNGQIGFWYQKKGEELQYIKNQYVCINSENCEIYTLYWFNEHGHAQVKTNINYIPKCPYINLYNGKKEFYANQDDFGNIIKY